MEKELPGTPASAAEAYGLSPLAPNGKRLPDSPPIVRKPHKVINGRREALGVLDKFLHTKVTRQRLNDVFTQWLDEAPRDFIVKVLIPLTPKPLIEEGVEIETKRDAVIQIVTNVPRPSHGKSSITLTVGEDPRTIDVEGYEK